MYDWYLYSFFSLFEGLKSMQMQCWSKFPLNSDDGMVLLKVFNWNIGNCLGKQSIH